MSVSVRYNYRLRPGNEAERALIQEWHRTRWIWNRAVDYLQTNGEWVRDSELTKWRAEHDWLRAGSVVAQQQELRNFRLKRAKGKGRRKFKSAKRTQPSLNYTKRGFSLTSEGRLRLPAGVSIPVVWSRELPSTPSSVRVYRDSLGHWFVSFVVMRNDAETVPSTGEAIGIDWGVRTLATTTNPVFDLPHAEHGKRVAARLAKAQRRMARRRAGRGKRASRGYQAAKRQAARVAKKAQRQRLDDARKWVKGVVAAHEFIAVEDFKPIFLAKTCLARKSSDGAIGLLKRVLIEVAERHRRSVVLVNPKFTSMDCSNCQARIKQRLSLSERMFHCSSCGAILDRDVNAAWNVLNRAGFHPATVDVVRRVIPSGIAAD
jgi:putative transposase